MISRLTDGMNPAAPPPSFFAMAEKALDALTVGPRKILSDDEQDIFLVPVGDNFTSPVQASKLVEYLSNFAISTNRNSQLSPTVAFLAIPRDRLNGKILEKDAANHIIVSIGEKDADARAQALRRIKKAHADIKSQMLKSSSWGNNHDTSLRTAKQTMVSKQPFHYIDDANEYIAYLANNINLLRGFHGLGDIPKELHLTIQKMPDEDGAPRYGVVIQKELLKQCKELENPGRGKA